MTRQEEPYKSGCFFDKKSSLLADLKRGFAQISFLFAALHVRQPDRLSVKFRPSFFAQCIAYLNRNLKKNQNRIRNYSLSKVSFLIFLKGQKISKANLLAFNFSKIQMKKIA